MTTELASRLSGESANMVLELMRRSWRGALVPETQHLPCAFLLQLIRRDRRADTCSLWRQTGRAPSFGATPILNYCPSSVLRQQCRMSGHPLDCLKCPSLCCRMAGYVEVSQADIKRLAKFLGMTVRAFEQRHIVETTRKGAKRIKSGYNTCQFLGEDRMCTVYEARPRDCRGYVCWNQQDRTVYDFARFFQTSPAVLREEENNEGG